MHWLIKIIRLNTNILYRLVRVFFGITFVFFLSSFLFHMATNPKIDKNTITKQSIAQLAYLRTALNKGAGEKMQELFPEGYFFTHVLYGLTWINIGLDKNIDETVISTALSEARWAFKRLNSEKGTRPFTKELKPTYGMFYSGWSNYLLSGILLLQKEDERNQAEIELYKSRSSELANSFRASSSPFLSSYPHQSWPADSFPGIVSLKVYDKLIEEKYHSLYTAWLDKALALVDFKTGLIPHKTDSKSGIGIEPPRGTSQTLILFFLNELDREIGKSQYEKFRQLFVVERFNLLGVKEYPFTTQIIGDIDSGPLIGGVSLSASTVALASSRIYDDKELENIITREGESLGLPIQFQGKRRYMFGLIPIGDAFYAWSRTAYSWLSYNNGNSYHPKLISNSFFLPNILLGTLLLIVILKICISDIGYIWLSITHNKAQDY